MAFPNRRSKTSDRWERKSGIALAGRRDSKSLFHVGNERHEIGREQSVSKHGFGAGKDDRRRDKPSGRTPEVRADDMHRVAR